MHIFPKRFAFNECEFKSIIFLVRKDQRKYARVRDLLTMNEELKEARKAFDEVKYVSN